MHTNDTQPQLPAADGVPPDWEMTPDFAWRTEIGRGCLIAAAAVAVLCLFQSFHPSFEIIDDDAISSWQPIFTDFAHQLQSGRMPVWSDYTQCGYPLLGWPQPTYVYPVHWISHLICRLVGWDARELFVSTFLHYFVAAAGSFVFLRRFGIIAPAAITATWGYVFSGVLLGLGSSWPIYVWSAAYWPLVLLAIEELRTGKASRFWTPFLGWLGGMGFLCNDLSMMIKYSLFAGLYFLLRHHRPTLWSNLKQIAIASVIALLIGIGQSVPSAEIILTSFRMGQGGTDVYATTPVMWVSLIFPFWILPWEYDNMRAAGGFFVGPCALLGALYAARSFPHLRGPHRALLILFVAYLGLALGHHWYPAIALQKLPAFSSFRWPFRWTLEASVALALVSGFGLHLAYEQLVRGNGRGPLLVFLVLAAFVLVMRYPAPPGLTPLTTWMTILWALGLAGLWLWARPEKRVLFLGLVCAWTIVAMIANIPVAQLTVMARMTRLIDDPLSVDPSTPERVLFLARHEEVTKPQCQGSLGFSFPHQFRTRSVFGYVYRPPGQSWMEGVEVNGLLYDAGEMDVIHRFLSPNSTLLTTLRVGHVVISQENPVLLQACEGHPNLRLERETAYYRFYRHDGFKASAFFVRKLIPETSRQDVVDMGLKLRLPGEALVESHFPGPQEYAATGEVSAFQENHGIIHMDVNSKDDGFLVVTTTYFSRWRAYLDRAEVPLYRVNGSFIGLRVPPGQHHLEMVYDPIDHLWLLAISGVSLVLVTGFCGWTLARSISEKPR